MSRRNSRNDEDAGLTKAEIAALLGEQFRISQNRSDVFDELAGEILHLNRTDQRCLDVISRIGRVTAGELAREAGLTTGGVTAVVDRLEREGWVRRIRDPRDRRKVLIECTPKFHEQVAAIWGPLAEAWQRQAQQYTRAELLFLLEFLREGNRIAEEHIERVRALRDEAN